MASGTSFHESLSVSRKRWLWLGIMCFFSVFQFLLQGSVGVMGEGIRQSFEMDAAGLGLLSSGFYASYMMMQVPAGLLYDRFGIRRVAASAVAVMMVGCFVLAWAPGFLTAFTGRVLMGFGCSAGFIGLLFGIKCWFSPSQMPLLIALSECVFMAGMSVANNVLSLGVRYLGWQLSLQLCGLISFGLFLAIVVFIRSLAESADSSCSAGSCDATETAGTSGHLPAWSVLKIREVWIGGFFSAGLFSVLSVFIALWAIPFFRAAYQMDGVQATFLASMTYAGVALGSPLVGWLSSRIHLNLLLTAGAAGTAVLMFLVLRAMDLPGFFLHGLLFLLGAFCSVYQFSFALVSAEAPSGLQGTAMGCANMLTLSTALIMQPAIGLMISSASTVASLSDSYGTDGAFVYQQGLRVLPWLMLLAFFLSFFLRYQGRSGWRVFLAVFAALCGKKKPVKSMLE